jgi:hypothetical protein
MSTWCYDPREFRVGDQPYLRSNKVECPAGNFGSTRAQGIVGRWLRSGRQGHQEQGREGESAACAVGAGKPA